MAIIKVDHVTKEFHLGQLVSLKQSVVNGLNRLIGRPVDERNPFKALDDVSFTVEKGEVLGIIGHNGAGKSTLLKLLVGISKPTSGRVSVIGKVAPLIEVGAGMVPDLTGRENIHLNCTILGIPKKEIARKFDQIVNFAELEEFIDTPIKRYSSGMKVKLGFAIATSIEAEILIVDEVLAVGDLAFQRKCFDRMEDLIKRQARTVLLVSHNIRQVERLCTRTILLNHGAVLADGDSHDVCGLFYERSDARIKEIASAGRETDARRSSTGEIDLIGVTFLDAQERPVERITYAEDARLVATFQVRSRLTHPIFGLGVHTTDFLYLATEISEQLFNAEVLDPGMYRVECRIPRFPLLPGAYSIRIGINAGEVTRNVFYAENVHHFQVVGRTQGITQGMREGFIELHGQWHLACPGYEDPVIAHDLPALPKRAAG